MERNEFSPEIDWWVYIVLIIMVSGCVLGLIYDGELIIGGLVLGAGMLALWLFAVTGVKYKICNNRLGIRNFYRWTWIPIDKIASVEKLHGVYVQGSVSATLSLDRVRITLSDRNVLKSLMPVDISPKDRDAFIIRLKEINPHIEIK